MVFVRSEDTEPMRANLERWLRQKLPNAEDLGVGPLERSGQGFSGETHLFQMRWRENGQLRSEKLVLRTATQMFPVFPEYDLGKQFRVMACLGESDVPVPGMRWLEETGDVLGVPFYIMECVGGDMPRSNWHGEGIFYEADIEKRVRLWNQAIAMVARIHALDWQRLGLSFLGVPANAGDILGLQLDYWESYLEWAKREPLSLHEKALDWLKQNRFEPERCCLCWGDPGLHNLVYTDDRVSSVLDWEMAYIGDPEADLAYFLVLDETIAANYQTPRLPGLPGEKKTVAYYESLGSVRISNLFYHRVFAAFKLAAIAVQVGRCLVESGSGQFPPDLAINNANTHMLETMLG